MCLITNFITILDKYTCIVIIRLKEITDLQKNAENYWHTRLR